MTTECLSPPPIDDYLRTVGFDLEMIGGGNLIFSRYVPSGARVWISDVEGGSLPTTDDWRVCFYPSDHDGEELSFDVTSEAGQPIADVIAEAVDLLDPEPCVQHKSDGRGFCCYCGDVL